MEPLMITVALVGGELSRKDTPFLPLTPDEIAAEGFRCAREGACILHLHARDVDGTPRHDRALFAAIVRKTDEQCESGGISSPILQFSTGGSIGMTVDERLAPLALRPEMATLTLGTVNFGEDIFENSLPTIRRIAQALREKKITPELEIFDAGMMDTARQLIEEGVLEAPLHFNFVLGVPGGLSGEVENLEFLLGKLPEGSTWSAAGIGRYQLPLNQFALSHGGHVRLGLEDNIYLQKGQLAEGNAPFVIRMKELAKQAGRALASPGEARRILRLRRS